MLRDQKITYAQGKALAAEFGCQFFETSAKNNTNVEEPFMAIATEIVTQLKQSSDGTWPVVPVVAKEAPKRRWFGGLFSKKVPVPPAAPVTPVGASSANTAALTTAPVVSQSQQAGSVPTHSSTSAATTTAAAAATQGKHYMQSINQINT